MSTIRRHFQVGKDWLKRKFIDLVRKGDRLQTPLGILFHTLEAYRYLPPQINALELFGMHGLWHTMDYCKKCRTLELYEIDPVYASYAKRFIPNATVIRADCIHSIKNNQLHRKQYNLIISDNPMGAPYGQGYYEHFDLFPDICTFLQHGILIVNFIYRLEGAGISELHRNKRVIFYGTEQPSIITAVKVYSEYFLSQGRTIADHLFIPKNDHIGYLAMVIR
ncbi:MAG: hypothetical protein QME74_07485 [Candidatus Edwardsbacteria bacterium]|nr:hypothetical protein [Candidatus Edwardsbacteria bacterium]